MEKNKALQVLKQYEGKAIVCARREEIEEISPQFESIVTVLELKEDDFAPVGGGNFYPQKALQNRMSDAAGIKFTENCGTKSVGSWSGVSVRELPNGLFEAVGEYAIIGWAQGYRLGPDGQPRTSSVCEYEFNVVDRCNMESFLGKYPPKSIMEARKKLLEFKKFATRRASTGAQLAVIRELTGVPTAFKRSDIQKPMLISQVVESNAFKMDVANKLMQTPDGRADVANAIFGNSRQLYGKAIQAPQESAPPIKDISPEAAAEEDPFSDFGDQDEKEPDPKADLLDQLEQYLHSDYLPPKGVELVTAAVNNPDQYTIEQIEDLLKRCKDAYDKRTGGAA